MSESDRASAWEDTRSHLENAREVLGRPAESQALEFRRVLGEYQQHYGQDEFGLALDALDALGNLSASSGDFWNRLADAAQSMGLLERASQLRRRA